MTAAREKICIVFVQETMALLTKASTKDMLSTLFGLAQLRENTLNIPVAYYTCGSKAFFFPIRKLHAKYLRIYEANFAIAEVHVDFSIMDSE